MFSFSTHIYGFASKFLRKAFSVNTFDSILDNSRGTMKRSLRGWQLLLLGLGSMVGAGKSEREKGIINYAYILSR